MKPQIKKSQLQHKDDIWNAMIHAICEIDFPTENTVENEAYLVFQYYSELESGGYESLLNWWQEYIQEVGIQSYLQSLTSILEKMGAGDNAEVLKKYGEDMWNTFVALEKDEISEDLFYEVIEKANEEYYAHNEQFQEKLESYFIELHTKLLDIIED